MKEIPAARAGGLRLEVGDHEKRLDAGARRARPQRGRARRPQPRRTGSTGAVDEPMS